MCLIVHKPEGKRIPSHVITSAMKYNGDGVGVMSADGVTKSANMSERKLLRTLDKLGDKECAVHLRMATHGRVNRVNTHPFRLQDGSWLMHNGIFSKFAPKTEKGKFAWEIDRSDTAEFCDRVCNAQLRTQGKLDESILEKACGYSNRLAIMRPGGHITRYGDWTEYQGLYVSNNYAWDSPYGVTYGWGDGWANYRKDANGQKYLPYIDDDFDTVYGIEQDVGESVIDSVYHYADRLFAQGNDIPGLDAEDSNRYKDMFVEGADASEFLEGCSARSMLAIYDALVRERYV